jgi:pimeloyl-ACP methyl ester carboxylesterase
LLRRGLLVLVLLLVIGALFQVIATDSDRRAYAAPGQFFTVEGHPMHLLCLGEGSPTVILEAAGGHFSATWALVQPEIAEATRVCSYDRAGYGWSAPGPEPRDATRIAAELHALLHEAGIAPPYILAGHSVGGVYIRVYHAQYPGEVVGMVLVDATHPDNWTRQSESIESLQAAASVSAVLSRFGLMRLAFGSQSFGLPAESEAALKADLFSSEYWDTQRADTASMPAILEAGRSAGDLGDMPLIVLAALDRNEATGVDIEIALQEELAALSSQGSLQIIPGAGHISLVTQPDYAPSVSAAILQVLDSARDPL